MSLEDMLDPRHRPLAAAAFAALALALPGCGGGSSDHTAHEAAATAVKTDQRAILDTIDSLQSAGRRGDGRTICEQLFTPRLAQSVEAAAHRSCAAEVRGRMGSPDEVISVERDIRIVKGAAAAKISEQNGDVSTVHLVLQAGRWRIDRLLPSKG
jgi:hypothetical protein